MFSCDICIDKKFNDPDDFANHITSEEHLALYEKSKESGSPEEIGFACEVCRLKFSGIIPYKQHCEGKKHLKKVEQLAVLQQQKKNCFQNAGVGSVICTNALESHSLDKIPSMDNNSSLSGKVESTEESQLGTGTSANLHTQMWSCNTCCKSFYDHDSFNQHFEESDHMSNTRKCNALKAKLQYGSASVNMDFLNNQVSDLEDGKQSLQQTENAESSYNLNDRAYDTSLYSQTKGNGFILPEDCGNISDADSTKMHCETCQITCTGFIPYSEHITSRKHKKQLEKQRLLKSETGLLTLPNKQEGSYSLEDKRASVSPPIRGENGDDSKSISESSQLEYFGDSITSSSLPAFANTIKCHICNIPCSGIIPYRQHMQSQKHAKELEKRKMCEEFLKNRSIPSGKEYNDDKMKKENEPELSRKMAINSMQSFEEESQISNTGGDLISFEETLSSNDEFSNLSIDETKPPFVNDITCEVCDIKCSGIIPFKQHMSSTKHLKMIEKKKWSSFTKKMKVDGNKLPEHFPDNESFLDNSDNSMDSALSNSPEILTCELCKNSFSGIIPYTQHMRSNKHRREVEKQEMLQKFQKKHQSDLFPKHCDTNYQPPYEACRNMEEYSNPAMISKSDKVIEENSSKTQCTTTSASISEMEDSVVVISEDDLESGCDKCGIGGFVNEIARNEHFQTKEHLQAANMNDDESSLENSLSNSMLESISHMEL